jgi:hypothetical protein
MATSRFEIPATATTAEAAAIAAAVSAHVRDQRAAAAAAEDGQEEDRPWEMAARRERLRGSPGRPPAGAPGDDWTAVTRLEGLKHD